jgi:L-ascorbate metabolism protein UlaG (beta-lactamase superfamily)
VRISWIGHSCFAVDAKDARIVMDPFSADVPYDFPAVAADIVTVSHEHEDHNAAARVQGRPIAVRGAGTHRVGRLEIAGIASSHGTGGGTDRGANTIFAFTLEGVRHAHLGDLGTPLDAAQLEALRDTQVLFVPVGGYYTIGATEAARIAGQLPDLRIAVPMHYRTDRISEWPIASVDEFLQTMDNVRRIEDSGVELTKRTLPETLEVWVLGHA